MHDTEFLDVIDEQGNVLRTVTREEAERDNHTTSNALVFIFTPRGEIWIQKRARTKKHFPGLWDISACGGIVNGEKPEESARREMEEEMGFTCEIHFVEAFLNEFPGEDGS
ncbi:MAG: NUDIX domain-containing protein, partial [Patescibacteria group bacterium]